MHDVAHGAGSNIFLFRALQLEGIIMCAMTGDPAAYFDKFEMELRERGATVYQTVITHE